jgi:hypothetical protein
MMRRGSLLIKNDDPEDRRQWFLPKTSSAGWWSRSTARRT